MKTLALLAALGSAALGLAGPLQGQAAPGEGVISLPEAGSPFIAFNIWIKAGSQNDPEGKEGLAYLSAQLLSGGATQQDSYQSIIEKLYPMAAGYGVSVDKEMTVFRGVVHRDNLEGYYQLFRNAVLAPAFAEEDFNRVKAQVLNFLERGRRFQRDEELSKELLFWMAYQGTPYEHPVEGYVESVRSITLDDVKAFYRAQVLSNNVVVGVGGGYPAGFAEKVRGDFDALPQGAVTPVPAPRPLMPNGVKILLVDKETDASAISMGFPIPLLRGDADFMDMTLVNAWFGEHRSSVSHLYQVIRERRGMNYGNYSYIEAFPRGFATQERPVNYGRRSSLFEIWIRPISGTGPDDLHDRTLFATRAAWRELDKLVKNGLPADQVDRAREYLHNFSVTFGSTVSRRLAFKVDDAFFGLPEPGYLGVIRPGLEKVTPATVKTAIGRNLQAGNMWIVIVTSNAEALKQMILSGRPTPIRYQAQQPPHIVEEDVEIAAFPFRVTADDITILPIAEVFERAR